MTKSKIFLYFCLSFAVGIGVGSSFAISVFFMGVVFVIGGSLIIVWWRYNWILVVLGFCLIAAVLGAYRYQAAFDDRFTKNHIAGYNDYKERALIIGIISNEPDERENSVKYEVKSREIILDNEKTAINGKFLVTMSKYPSYNYGDLVEFKGKVKTPAEFPDFSYKNYLSRYDIYSVMYYPQSRLIDARQGNPIYTFIFSLKNSFQENIGKILPEPHSSFLSGLLLGTKKQMPQGLLDDFNKTGTTHIVAISGYNITIIAFLVANLLLLLGLHRYWSFWISVAAIILFSILTGASASVVRASVMGILILVASRLGRLSRITNALVFSGVLMLAVNPKLLRFDIGFQLSFLATVGLVFFSERLNIWLDRLTIKIGRLKEVLKPVRDSLSATLSAQIFVVPILVYNFSSLSLISPLANVMILPVIPLTMLAGFIGSLLAFVWMPLGKAVGYLAWIFLEYEIKVVEILSSLPLASIEIKKISWILIAGYYIAAAWVYYRFYLGIKNKDIKKYGNQN